MTSYVLHLLNYSIQFIHPSIPIHYIIFIHPSNRHMTIKKEIELQIGRPNSLSDGIENISQILSSTNITHIFGLNIANNTGSNQQWCFIRGLNAKHKILCNLIMPAMIILMLSIFHLITICFCTKSSIQMSDEYWTSRYKLFEREEKEEGNINVKEATKNYATAWTIFAALLMTVSFSLIPVDTGSFYENNSENVNRIISYGYVGLLFVSAIFSFLAVLCGTFRYTFFDGIPSPMIYQAIEAITLPGAQTFVYPAMGTQMLASAIGSYLFLGIGVLILALSIFLIIFVPGFLFVLWRYKQSTNGIVGLQMGVAVNLGQKTSTDVNVIGDDDTGAVKDNNNGDKESQDIQETEQKTDIVVANGVISEENADIENVDVSNKE
eukprot:251066_1